MNKRMWFTIMTVLMIASIILGACSAPTATPAVTQPPAATKAQPAATQAQPAATQPQGATDPWANVDPSGQTVVFWHVYTQAFNDEINKIVDNFNSTNQWGITVDPEYQGYYNDIFNKMLGVLNTQDAPSLVVAYQNQAATYQLADSLVDMNPMVNSPKWGLSEADQKDFFPGFWQQDVFPSYGNARLGFPPNRSMEVMYYNMDWLKELGYDAPPTTPDQFKEMTCKAVQQPFSKATAQGPMGYELSNDASRLASWAFAFGGDIFDYNASKFTYNSDAAQQAMAFMQDLFKGGCATMVTEQYGDQTDFGTGKLLFTIGSSAGLPYYQQAVDGGAKFNWSIAAIPHTTPDPVMNIYGPSISMPKTTPEQELAAWLFLKYFTSTDVQAEWAKVTQYFPVRASVADGLADFFAANPSYKTAFDMLKYSHFEPPVPGYDFVRSKAQDAIAAITNGDDVKTTLDDLNQQANSILSEQMTAPLPTPVPTKPPATATPAASTMGTADNPIIVAFEPSATSQEITAGGQELLDQLSAETGLTFKGVIPTSYAALTEAMGSGNAQIGWMATFAYILAHQKGFADVALITNRFGSDHYGAQFIARADAGFTPAADTPATDAEIDTLLQFKGKRPCFTDPQSTSGYVIPLIFLKKAGLNTDTDLQPPVFAQGHTQVVRAVYAGGICDFGATFVDARTGVTSDLPDVMDKVVVVYQTKALIPNDNMSYAPDMPQDLRDKVTAAMLKIADTEAGKKALQDLYQIGGLVQTDDTVYDEFRSYLQASGVDLSQYVK
jgi:multiple sugar transport system substrate-binding protein